MTKKGLDVAAIPAKDPAIVSREIAGEIVLVPIRQNVGDLDSIFTLNEVATRIWELIDGTKGLAEIRDAIVEEFDVDASTAEADLHEFLAGLQATEAVRVG